MQPFYLGLNMSGTVSAGAYTAGVIDFLVDAMDAWYAERARQIARFGTNYEQWTIPPHELELAVMTGASGGGITAALAAAALGQNFDHVRKESPQPGEQVNTLFQSWVRDIDLTGLLGHADLDANRGNVLSILDSTPIREIASHAFEITAPLNERRPWVRDGLQVILTLTNLRGVPYAIESETADSERTLDYADRRDYEVFWNGNASGIESVLLDARGNGPWDDLAQAAIATSAFPVVLAPQTLNRTGGDYNKRLWRISHANPKCGEDGTCQCEHLDTIRPDWDMADGSPYETLNVDGGATNNSPFDLARIALSELPSTLPGGHDPRDPQFTDRAVVSIAPLATEITGRLPPMPEASMFPLLGRFVTALVNQSRIQGENLKLIPKADVGSRWIIAPNSVVPNTEPLAGSLLSAFGGFVAQVFREHDYQLGRRNCQWFLRSHFGLPWDNAIMRQYSLSRTVQDRLDAQFGFAAAKDETTGTQTRLFPLIPVMPEVAPEITVVRNAIDQDRLKTLGDLALDRVKRVAKALLVESGDGMLSDVAFNAAWLFIKGKLRNRLLTYAGFELAKQGFVE